MRLSDEDVDFLGEMAMQLDETIQALTLRETSIERALGSPRIEELRELWEVRLADETTEDLSQMDCREREVLGIWNRKERLYAQRLNVGRRLMLQPSATEKRWVSET